MGSRTSKDASAAAGGSSSSSSSSGRLAKRCRSFRVRFFTSACLGMPRPSTHAKLRQQGCAVNEKASTRDTGTSLSSGQPCSEEESKSPRPSPPSVVSNSSTGAYDRLLSGSHTDDLNTTTESDVASTSLHFRSPFGLFNDGVAFTPAGAAYLATVSDSRPILSRSFSIPNAGIPACVHHLSQRSGDVCSEPHQDDALDSASTALLPTTGTRPADAQLHRTGVDGHAFNDFASRRTRRRLLEPLEGTARFSRTLSVGRLRDRVLRRTVVPEGRFPFGTSADRPLDFLRQPSAGQFLSGGATGITPSSSVNDNPHPFPDVSPNLFSTLSGTPDTTSLIPATQTTVLAETTTTPPDTFEQRSAFLERRRRIRSQVRALQRLGNRFENLSAHDRSCILSGQHRTGHCSCRAATRAANSTDETGTRASISRIVMLAEALFEVLDEIHQQAVVLASRPSLSSIGSVPAPKEIVDGMPLKIYTKSSKSQTDEPAQCYICLVEYEEGDHLRILPCHHEFHQSCVDKWLKEIHRVCPLCRGDVCINDISHTEVD